MGMKMISKNWNAAKFSACESKHCMTLVLDACIQFLRWSIDRSIELLPSVEHLSGDRLIYI